MGPSSAPAIKTIFKIHDGGQPVCLSDQFCITTRRWDFFDFQDGGRQLSRIFKINIFNSCAS